MILSTTVWNLWDAASLALTPLERWSAVRRVDPRPPHEYSPLLAILVLLLALVVLLWLVGRRRKSRRAAPPRESFWDEAVRRFSSREREILAAIAARSGLRRREDIVTTVDAFDRGAARLLKEDARTRTSEELARLRADVARLRQTLTSGRGRPAEARTAAEERTHSIAMHAPGAVARFPWASAGSVDDSRGQAQPARFEFAPATATYVEGSTIQIDSPLPVQIGETLLVILRLPSTFRNDVAHEADRRERLVGHVGRVTDVKAADGGTSITVELISMADLGIDAAQLAGAGANVGNGPMS